MRKNAFFRVAADAVAVTFRERNAAKIFHSARFPNDGVCEIGLLNKKTSKLNRFFTENQYIRANLVPKIQFNIMRKTLFCLLIACFLSIFRVAGAKPLLKCTEFQSGGALDHSRVACYVQDSKGFLWLGTWIGLCRYDGKEFHYFRNDGVGQTALGSNRVMKITIDSRENIWCHNYDQGLYRFDRKTCTFQSVLPLVKQYPAVQAMRDKAYAMVRNHAVWTVLADGTLVRFNDADPSDNDVLPCPAGQKNRTVYEVREDSRAREWILTDQGVIIYGQGTIATYPYSRFIERAGHCLLAASTTAQVVEYMPDGTLRTVAMPEAVKRIHTIQSQRGTCVAIGTDAGLVLYDVASRQTRFVNSTTDGRPLRNVARTMNDKRGRVWCFDDGGGIYCIMPDSDVAHFLPTPKASVAPTSIDGKMHLLTEDAFGTVWVKPLDGNLCWVDEATLTLHPGEECLSEGTEFPFADINFYFVDAQRNLWVSSGTKVYELSFGQRQFQTMCDCGDVEVRSMLEADSLHLLYGDRQGRIGCIDMADGSRRYLTPQGRWSTQPVSFIPDGVYSMLRDRSGHIWVGSRGGGLSELSPMADGFAVRRYVAGGGAYDLNCNNIYDLYEDEHGRLWIATFGGGLNLADRQPDGTLHFLHAGNELLGYPINAYEIVRCICGDGKGHILLGTNRGLLAFPTDFERIAEVAFTPYEAQSQQSHPLQDNMVMQLACDTAGSFYVATYARGLSRVHGMFPDSLWFEPMPNRDFPAGDVMLSAIALRSGALWAVAGCGITCFDTSNGNKWYFDEHDFDRPYNLSECKPVEMTDGRVCMGMEGGILSFRPDELHKNVFSPAIVFTERLYAEGTEQHRQHLNDIDTLVVEPNQRSTSLHFAAIDLVPSSLIRYAYWMQAAGDDDQPKWVHTVTPEVNFANLAPGQYTLHLRSTNSAGVWCDNPRQLTIRVVPTFWERWGWVFGLVALLTVALAVVLWYVHRLKQRQRMQVKQEVSAAKIEMLSHQGSEDRDFIQRLLAVFEPNMSDCNLQVNDLCDKMCMSRATFYRRLKQAVDLSPNEFIHQVRMKRAAEQLVSTDAPISSIAYGVGFNNPKYFSRCFRQDFGCSPLEYRHQRRQQLAQEAANTEA